VQAPCRHGCQRVHGRLVRHDPAVANVMPQDARERLRASRIGRSGGYRARRGLDCAQTDRTGIPALRAEAIGLIRDPDTDATGTIVLTGDGWKRRPPVLFGTALA
jgi:hypothetical protein